MAQTDPDLRRAAAELGAVMYVLQRRRVAPGPWLFDPDSLHAHLLAALNPAYVLVDQGSLRVDQALPRYWASLEFVERSLAPKAREWLRADLAVTATVLRDLRNEVTHAGAAQLQAGAKRVNARLATYQPRLTGGPADAPSGRVADQDWQRMAHVAYAGAVGAGGPEDDLLRILFHARVGGPKLMREFLLQPNSALKDVLEHIAEAESSVGDLIEELTDDADHFWRYPLAVLGGVGGLGLADVPVFSDYALALAAARSSTRLDDALFWSGMVLTCLGLVFATGGGALAIAAADATLAVAGAALTYLREREQSIAASASQFRPAQERIAEPTWYVDSIAATAGALVSAIAVVRKAKELRAVVQPPRSEAPPSPPRALPAGRGTGAPTEAAGAAGAVGDRGVSARGVAQRPSAPSARAQPEPAQPLREPARPAAEPARTASEARVAQSAPESRGVPNRGTAKAPRVDPRLTGLDRDTAGTGGIHEILLGEDFGDPSVTIKGVILPPLANPGETLKAGQLVAKRFNQAVARMIGSAAEEGFPGYEWAHLWGPRFGDEAAAGMMLAPGGLNRSITATLERAIQDLAKDPGAVVRLEATAVAWRNPPRPPRTPGVHVLRHAEYRVAIELPGEYVQRVAINVEVAPPGGVGAGRLTGGGVADDSFVIKVR